MSTNLFSGARKALVASIATAVLLGGVTLVTTPYAAASTTVAAVSVSAKINAFTNIDWLNGVWRTGAGFSIPATAANQAAFKAGASVRLADGQVRTISRQQIVGANMSIFLDGAKLDGNKVGAPQVVTIGSSVVTAPVTSPTTVTAHSTSINAFTNTDWLNGVWRKSPGFSIPANDANKAAFKVGASVKLADGQVRKVTQVQVVGANMSVYLDGAAVNGSVVGAPNKLSTAGTTTATPAPAPTSPTTSVIATSNLNNFTNNDWLNGMFRASAGFSIQASSANVAAFKAGALVRLADGQTRKVLRQQVVGSNMSVFLEGAAINGTSLGYPKTVSVVSTSASTPSSPALTTPPATVTPAPAPSAPDTTNGKPLLVGVNLSGAGFGPSVVPGTHGTNYTYPAESYYKKYADLGMPLVRLPFLWERIQPKLGTPLNTVELARLKQSLDFAQKHNVKVILDLHNYYRYFGKLIGSNEVPISSFAAVWKQIVQEVVNHPAVEGYGLMNEPHSTNGLWPQAALAAAQAIRTVDSKRWIYVAGDRWSSAFHWPHYNTQLISNPWMRDPKNNLVYEAHMYIDKDFSGNYFDKNEQFDPMIGVNRVKPFVDWLKQNKLRGYIGEHGIPDFSPSALVATDNLMSYLRQNCIPSTYWAAGPWWGEYALSLDVTSGKHRPQLPVLQKHAKTAHSCTSIGPL
ncbi:cellulase [Stutzerimonas decontaminans]|uniref:Cellulase n=2 Tax=Stutzerimonas TaxID=2901164 RepID=A0ABX4VZR9_9GAMM|nr:glycoside hydrolase family 5 protein [Stutzerimonas decontaminans]AHY43679.1 cellulase [Stutzerimonas decontaminans]MCQ4245803.1 glycoside hydrolase family 5 protein [Stutzerimonas decontaminans]MCW8156805.1 glycoside hydrolase family 5 protein [Stutzerimonas stutzeri]PNF84816.1 cellulase [Stutzerimonas decontaminans]